MPAHEHLKEADADWASVDITAALWKAGWSMRQLSLANGLAANTLGAAINRPYPKGERIIAKTLGVTPQSIWPSRYDEHGRVNRRRGRAPRRPVQKHTRASSARNAQD
jgi:Ner family transcriptional regulator